MQPTPSDPPATPLPPEVEHEAKYKQVKNGANWFYWIAGLSIVNTFLTHFGSNIQFVLGLALTQIVDAVAAQAFPGVKWFSLVFGAILAGTLVFFGFKAGQAFVWAFLGGLAVFLLDCALFAWIILKFGAFDQGVVFGIVFRIVALVAIFGGLGAAREFRKLKAQYAAAPAV